MEELSSKYHWKAILQKKMGKLWKHQTLRTLSIKNPYLPAVKITIVCNRFVDIYTSRLR